MPVIPCGASRTRKPRSTSSAAFVGCGEVAGRSASAEQPRLDLRLDQHVARALRDRPIELVAGVGERDARDLADLHAAILELAADVEALHRFVEVGLDGELRREPAAAADDQQDRRPGDHGADDEQAELEVVALAGSRRAILAPRRAMPCATPLVRRKRTDPRSRDDAGGAHAATASAPARGGRTRARADRRSRRAGGADRPRR